MHEWGAALLVAMAALGCTAAPTSRTPPVAPPDNQAMKLEVLGSLVPCLREAVAIPPPAAPPPDVPPPDVLPPDGGRPGPFEPGIFVEMAILEVPARAGEDGSSRDLRALALDPGTRLLGAPHLFLVPSRPVTFVVEEHFGPLGALALRDVTAELRATGTEALVVDFALGLDLPTARDVVNAMPWRIEVRATTAPSERGLSAFAKRVPTEPARQVVVVFTPYAVRGDADFRALFECKMARRKARAQQLGEM